MYFSYIVILVETRIASDAMNKIISKSYLMDCIYSEVQGYAGGTWIMWNNSKIQLEEVSIDDQIVNVFVRQRGKDTWLLSVVYASPKVNVRIELWLLLGYRKYGRRVDIP